MWYGGKSSLHFGLNDLANKAWNHINSPQWWASLPRTGLSFNNLSLSLPLSFFIYLNLSLYPLPHWSKWRLLVECRYWLPRSDIFSSTNIQGCQCGWGPIDWDLGDKKSWELEAEKNRCKWRAINYMWQESNSVSLLHQSPTAASDVFNLGHAFEKRSCHLIPGTHLYSLATHFHI